MSPLKSTYANDRVSNAPKAGHSHFPELRVSLPLQFHALCHFGQPKGIGTAQGMQRVPGGLKASPKRAVHCSEARPF